MNIYNSSFSPATTPLIAVQGARAVLPGAAADGGDGVAGGFNGVVGCQIDTAVFFRFKQKREGGESGTRAVEKRHAKTSISRGLFSLRLG